jgi:hypothetical protein
MHWRSEDMAFELLQGELAGKGQHGWASLGAIIFGEAILQPACPCTCWYELMIQLRF